MHIIAGLLGALVTVLYLLDRVGVDLGWLNPWAWRRRRAWSRKFESDPIYSIQEPIEVAAVIIVGVAKLQGDLTADQKAATLRRFEEEFGLGSRAASELLGSVTHLLGAPQVIRTQLEGVLSRNRQAFSPEQAQSLIELTQEISAAGGGLNDEQQSFIEQLRSSLVVENGKGKWG